MKNILGPVLIGVSSLQLSQEDRDWLQHPAVGGVVLFSRNYQDQKQLDELVAAITEAVPRRLLLCVDQEGGRVQRFKDGFTRLPALGSLAQLYRQDSEQARDFAYRHGRVMASEVLAWGVDLSFAPVLDLNRGSCVIGDRSLGDHPDAVIELGAAYLAGMHDAGMSTTGKHFPGHGSVVADSHVDDVLDPRGFAELSASDLQPFIQLQDQLDAMMIAHVVYSAVDNLPAGYSAKWLQQHLRGDLAYKGTIFSDDLGMHAAKTAGNLYSRTMDSLEAGCDAVLVCQPDDVRALFNDLKDSPKDATQALSRLYGAPSVQRDELALVGEWRQWVHSLEQMS